MLKGLMVLQNGRLYDLIFPFFMMWILPPIMLITLIGNYIIDGAIIFIIFHAFRMKIGKLQWLHLTKMWGLGLLIDVLGTIVLFLGTMGGSTAYTIWNAPLTAILFISVVLICGLLLGFANYHFTKKRFHDVHMAKVMGLAMGIITAPWTFLIPTSLFFK